MSTLAPPVSRSAERPPPARPPLVVGRPGDRYELEADQIADAALDHGERAPTPSLESVPSVRRQPIDTCGDHVSAPTALARRLDDARQEGQPLPARQRAVFEERLGHSFGSVRVHAGPRAATAAAAAGAQAFTHGQDVYFGAGYYRPDTGVGRRLLAHELGHTMQQRPGVISRQPLAGAVVAEPPVADASPTEESQDSEGQPPRAIAEQIRALLRTDPSDSSGQMRDRITRLPPAQRVQVLTALRAEQVEGRDDEAAETADPERVTGTESPPAPAPRGGGDTRRERRPDPREEQARVAAAATVPSATTVAPTPARTSEPVPATAPQIPPSVTRMQPGPQPPGRPPDTPVAAPGAPPEAAPGASPDAADPAAGAADEVSAPEVAAAEAADGATPDGGAATAASAEDGPLRLADLLEPAAAPPVPEVAPEEEAPLAPTQLRIGTAASAGEAADTEAAEAEDFLDTETAGAQDLAGTEMVAAGDTGLGGAAEPMVDPAEVAARMEGYAAELEAALGEARDGLQMHAEEVGGRLRQEADAARAGVRAEVQRTVAAIQAGSTALLADLARGVEAAGTEVDRSVGERAKEADKKGADSQKEIQAIFTGHRNTVEKTVKDSVTAAEDLRRKKAESTQTQNRADIATAKERGVTKYYSYGNSERGRFIGGAAWQVAKGTADKMSEQETEILQAVAEMTAPLPEYFRSQGAQALDGFDVNLPSILASVDTGVTQTKQQLAERAGQAKAKLAELKATTETEIADLTDKAVTQAQAFAPQMQAQIDRALASAMQATAAAPAEVLGRIAPPIEEAIALFRTAENPDPDAAGQLTEALVGFVRESAATTGASLDQAADAGQQRFAQVRDGARQSMNAHRVRCDTFWQSSRTGLTTTLPTLVKGFDAGFGGVVDALGTVLKETEESIRKQLAPTVAALDGGFGNALGDAERQIDSRIANGMAKNTEALGEMNAKMEEAADDAAWEYDHPILSTLAFIGGLIVGIVAVLLVVVGLIALTLFVGWALGISALAAGLVVLAGMAAFSIGFALGARLAAGQGFGEALGGALVDFGKAVPGMLYEMTGIPKLKKAFSNEYMTPYKRGKLVGEGGTELVLAIFAVRGAAKGAAGLYRNLGKFKPAAVVPELIVPRPVVSEPPVPRPVLSEPPVSRPVVPEPAAAPREPRIGFGREPGPRAVPAEEPRIGFGREPGPRAVPAEEPRIGFGREPGPRAVPAEEPRIGFGREPGPRAVPAEEPRIGFGREPGPRAVPAEEPRIGFGREPGPRAVPAEEPRIGFGREPGPRAPAAAEAGPPTSATGGVTTEAPRPRVIETQPSVPGGPSTAAETLRPGGRSPVEVRAGGGPGGGPGQPRTPGQPDVGPPRIGTVEPAAGPSAQPRPGGRSPVKVEASSGGGKGPKAGAAEGPRATEQAAPGRKTAGGAGGRRGQPPVDEPANVPEQAAAPAKGGGRAGKASKPGAPTAEPAAEPAPGSMGKTASGRPRATPEPDPTPPTQQELAQAKALGKNKPARFTRLGDVWRWLRYKAEGGKKLFSEWVKGSRGSRGGGPNHEAIQDRLSSYSGADREVAVGRNAADAYWPEGTNGAPRDTYHQIGRLNEVRGDPVNRERLNFEAMFNYFRRRGMDVEMWFWDRDNPALLDPVFKLRTNAPLSEQPGWTRAFKGGD